MFQLYGAEPYAPKPYGPKSYVPKPYASETYVGCLRSLPLSLPPREGEGEANGEGEGEGKEQLFWQETRLVSQLIVT